MTRAETYGPLQQIERQMDEYYEALSLDPRRARLLREDIVARTLREGLHEELGLTRPADDTARDSLLQGLDAYLCEIKESQIRDGLHTLGSSPQGRQRIDTLVALARFPAGAVAGQKSLLVALAQDLALEGVDGFNVLGPDWAAPWQGPRPPVLQQLGDDAWRHAGHTRERLELLAAQMVAEYVVAHPAQPDAVQPAFDAMAWPHTTPVLQRLRQVLGPRLDACGPQEMAQLLRGLGGRFVPPGPSGAP